MATYQLTPYLVSFTPKGDPDSPFKLANLPHGDKTISAVEAIFNTVSALKNEPNPRSRSDDKNRLLDIQRVNKIGERQVEIHCELGVKGYHSDLELEAFDQRMVRRYNDAEWFSLRAMFAAEPSARRGILLVEGAGNRGFVTHLSELLKSSIRHNLGDQVLLRIDPIQDAAVLGSALADLETKFLEFKTVVKTNEPADNATNGGKDVPVVKTVKLTRRGGLGKFNKFLNRNANELADKYGFIRDDMSPEEWDAVEVSAVVKMKNGKDKRVNPVEGRLSSVAFEIERSNEQIPPTLDEFKAAASKVVSEIGESVGLMGLEVTSLSTTDSTLPANEVELNWKVPDYAPAAKSGEHN